MNLEILEQNWKQSWGYSPYIAHEIKNFYNDRRLRFYSLKSGKRYPENDEEMASLILRHNTILNEISDGRTLNIILANWSNDERASNLSWPEGYRPPNDLKFWQTIDEDTDEKDAEFKSYRHLFVHRFIWHSNALDELLKCIAEDKLTEVIIAPDDFNWLYQPYDGGADAFFKIDSERARLYMKYSEWIES